MGWAWLRQGEAALMLNTAYDTGERPPIPDPARVVAHGDTALFLGCQDLDGVYAHLVAHGVRAEPPTIAPYGTRQVYATDPDGYGLCFQWPAERRESRASAGRRVDRAAARARIARRRRRGPQVRR